MHLVVDALGLPVAFKVTVGQQHDSRSALPLIAKVEPNCLLGDKAYDVDAIREELQARDALAVIPPKANRKAPAAFDKELYKARSAVECTLPSTQTSPPIRNALREDLAKLRRSGRDWLCNAVASNLATESASCSLVVSPHPGPPPEFGGGKDNRRDQGSSGESNRAPRQGHTRPTHC